MENPMYPTEILGKMADSFGSTANVKSVFGEPIHAEGKTIVPVAKVAYGFGGGGGANRDDANGPHGGGGGGGMRAFPAGVLEITQTETRFIPYFDLRMLVGVFAAGALLGRLLLRRR
jgi:uncharacterized spore protein YtfJ